MLPLPKTSPQVCCHIVLPVRLLDDGSTTSSASVSGSTLGRSKSASKSEIVLVAEANAKEVETKGDARIEAGAFSIA